MSRNDAIYEEEYMGLNIYIVPDTDYWAEQKEKELKLYDERMTK